MDTATDPGVGDCLRFVEADGAGLISLVFVVEGEPARGVGDMARLFSGLVARDEGLLARFRKGLAPRDAAR